MAQPLVLAYTLKRFYQRNVPPTLALVMDAENLEKELEELRKSKSTVECSGASDPLPCPCCGGKATYYPSDHELRMDGMVECSVCGLSLEELHSAATKPNEALEKWNQRVKAC